MSQCDVSSVMSQDVGDVCPRFARYFVVACSSGILVGCWLAVPALATFSIPSVGQIRGTVCDQRTLEFAWGDPFAR
jgi:hypothetical protein